MPDLFNHTRYSLGAFLRNGYQIDLRDDGNATVTKPDGTVYTINNFVCDCPNKQARGGGSYFGRCKHELALAQIYPCQICDTWAILVKVTMPTGEEIREYRCANRHIFSFEEVQKARRT